MEKSGQNSERTFDVIVIGAGISGINSAYRLQTELPSASYTILERRSAIGGTWDLFRYPGIRSDSRLWTFGFPWRPWTEDRSIAEGHAILKYMGEAARDTGIDSHMRFGRTLRSANWSSEAQCWALQVDEVATDDDDDDDAGGASTTSSSSSSSFYHCRFLLVCTGYYDYDHPLEQTIPGLKNFKGQVIHPQFWPRDASGGIDGLSSKRVVVIGSGATAITLLPALAEKVGHVTMLQRSPSYVVSSRAADPLALRLRRWLPVWLTYRVMRLRSMITQSLFLKYCTLFPARARGLLRQGVTRQLPASIPYDPHFKPAYGPWEQRLCLCPDGDFYKALRGGKASVVTDTIKNISESRIELTSGEVLDADVVVTATGLKLQFGGGATFSVDNEPVDFATKFSWKCTMLQDVPNVALPFGYPNLSWTLGADCAAWLVIRLLKYMDTHGYASATPRLNNPGDMEATSMLQLTSTYVSRGQQSMPKAGNKAPWQPRTSYMWDLWDAKGGSLVNCMEYQKASS